MSGTGWTIDELAQQAAATLSAAGVRSPNGRVTALPDRRVIRWYATIGLLDPPLRARGRTARYGERHLLQLVAVKRRQAQGRSLTEIQAELAGATDTTLRRVADLSHSQSWTPAAPGGAPIVQDLGDRRFWAEPATATPATATPTPTPATAVEPVADVPAPVYPVPLHPAATLHLSGQPTPADLAAIHAAARPLLDLLAARGLLTRPEPGAGASPRQPGSLPTEEPS